MVTSEGIPEPKKNGYRVPLGYQVSLNLEGLDAKANGGDVHADLASLQHLHHGLLSCTIQAQDKYALLATAIPEKRGGNPHVARKWPMLLRLLAACPGLELKRHPAVRRIRPGQLFDSISLLRSLTMWKP